MTRIYKKQALRLRQSFGLWSCLLLMAAWGWSSCTEDLELQKDAPHPVLVLNSVVAPGAPVKVGVQRTVYIPNNDIPRPAVNKANVILTVNGEQQPPLVWNVDEGLYVSAYEPKSGDRIAVNIAEGGDSASAEVTVPQVVPIDTMTLSYIYYGRFKDLSMSTGNSECRFNITFRDRAGEKNYYFLRVLDEKERPIALNLTDEDVFRDAFAGLNGIDEASAIDGSAGAAFSDELFDGKEYTLRVGELFYSEGRTSRWEPNWRTVQLYAVSEDYYKYLHRIFNDGDLSISENLAKVGLAEPVSFASNVKGGAGILGAFQMVSKKVYIVSNNKNNTLEFGQPAPRRPNEWWNNNGESTVYAHPKQ